MRLTKDNYAEQNPDDHNHVHKDFRGSKSLVFCPE